jgi:hypothetical protein
MIKSVLFCIGLTTGLVWLFMKKKEPYHFFVFLLIVGMNLDLLPIEMPKIRQIAFIMITCGGFMLYDLAHVRKIEKAGIYAIPVFLYGLKLMF